MNREKVRTSIRSLLVSFSAVGFALVLSMLIIAITGASPSEAMRAIYDGAFGSKQQLAGTLAKMVPLVLVALGWIVAFSTGKTNVGFPGQLLLGGAAATIVGINAAALPLVLHLPIAIAAGALAGALWVGIAAWMWASKGIHEMITTLLLNLIAIQLISWLVLGPLSVGPTSFRTQPVADSAQWPTLITGTSLTWDVVLIPIFVIGVAVMLRRTTFGFRLRLIGANPQAARHAGVHATKTTVFALLASGAIAGVAGSSLILASRTHSMAEGFDDNFGFEGIVVALLARNNPYGVVPASLLFAALRQGSGILEARLEIPSEIVSITVGLIVLLVAGASFLAERRRAPRLDTSLGDESDTSPAAEPETQRGSSRGAL